MTEENNQEKNGNEISLKELSDRLTIACEHSMTMPNGEGIDNKSRDLAERAKNIILGNSKLREELKIEEDFSREKYNALIRVLYLDPNYSKFIIDNYEK